EISYASNSRNEDTVAVEVCHPDDTGAFAPASYDRAVELTAWLCREFKLNPQRDVLRHYDVSGKICPKYYVENPEAWAEFLADTESALANLQAEA
ncbi:MAG: peptidoglycan recognition family protein, partial [Oscillibacter sp.]